MSKEHEVLALVAAREGADLVALAHAVVVFAASERGRYLTGANISTDGAASHVVV